MWYIIISYIYALLTISIFKGNPGFPYDPILAVKVIGDLGLLFD